MNIDGILDDVDQEMKDRKEIEDLYQEVANLIEIIEDYPDSKFYESELSHKRNVLNALRTDYRRKHNIDI